jgi:chromosome transmission fidelity protein 4
VEAGKLERALDLVDRLQLEKSYELAMTIAGNHDKLVDYIEEAKEKRFAVAYDEEEDDYDGEDDAEEYEEKQSSHFEKPVGTSPEHRTQAMRRISPDASTSLKSKRSFGQHQPGALQRNVRARAF